MNTKKHLEKIKDFVEDNKDDFDKDSLMELGSTALLLLSGFAGNKLIRSLVMGAIIITAGKLAYDYLTEKAEESEKA